jgi:DNA-directed RNA polymerase subunit RPC12/RpoP
VNGEIHCTHCGATGLQQGFVEDEGQYSAGYAQWIAGALERGPLGNARRMGRSRTQIDAFRCPQCGHLELFTLPPR